MLFKIDAIIAGVSVGEKRSGNWKPGSKDKMKFIQYLSSIAKNKIIIPDHPVRKPAQVLAMIQEYKPDIVAIDGAYLMSINGAATVEWQELAAVSRELKSMANNTGVPIIGVIQANRGASDKQTVGGENIAGSDAFFQDPDIVLALRHMINGSDNLQRQVALSTTKNRHGIFVATTVNYDFSLMNMREEI
jgi:replicative DNA helicase